MCVEDRRENVVLVHLPREVREHVALQTTIDTVGKKADCDVVVDFSNVDIAGSPTFSRLLELRKVLRGSGHRLILCNVAPATRDVFAVAQLDRLFDFAEDESAALAILHTGK